MNKPVPFVKPEPKPKPEPINNTDLVNAFRALGGRIIHIRPNDRRFGNRSSRGLTLAFVPKNSRVEIATAVQHRNDEFTKKKGTKLAIEHFMVGKSITIPVPNVSSEDLDSELQWMFAR